MEQLVRRSSTNCKEDGPLLLRILHVIRDEVMLQFLNVRRPVIDLRVERLHGTVDSHCLDWFTLVAKCGNPAGDARSRTAMVD